jgi:hypothetical protein
MIKTKRLGIWIDHSSAHVTEFTPDILETKTLTSDFTYQDKQQTLARSENVMHNKEQQQQTEYYKKLGEVIRNYTDVVLFGPTDAKVELFNSLRKDHRFDKIKIGISQTDKMTEQQQHAFIKEYFSEH